MICPHCNQNITYRQRGNRRCGLCKQEFALEPRTLPLRLHDLRFKKLVAKFSDNGRLFYTASQLHHYLSRKAVAEQKPCSIGYAIAPAAVIGLFVSLALSIKVGLVLALLSLGIGWRYIRPFRPQLPMKAAQFSEKVIERWRSLYDKPTGLLEEVELARLSDEAGATTQLQAVLTCSQRDILNCLRANGIPATLGLGLLPTGPPYTPAEITVLEVLRAQPHLPLLVLHDASPAGCLLVRDLPRKLGLNANHRIIDVGIRPLQAITHKMMRLGVDPPVELLNKLRQQRLLSSEELAWLEKGFYTPILALSPAQLIRIVTRVVKHTTAKRSADLEQEAQARAHAIGFMSWPE